MSEAPSGTDTRARIQDVALKLFTEHGYEKTSLREIADRLGVTKAALYYHFKSKEEIVQTLIEERTAVLEDLWSWIATQPRSAGTRREFIRRYAAELHRGRYHMQVMHLIERNPTLGQNISGVERMRGRLAELMALLSPPDASPQRRLKGSLGLIAIHASSVVLRDLDLTDEERLAAALDVALELVD